MSEPEAATTWALVVGIDQYDNPAALPALKGAVKDAVAAVGWLRGLGVPDDHILLRAAPSPESRPALDGLGLAWDGASEPKIWAAVARLSQVQAAEGTRLFVFLSGHGLYEPDSGRIFLTQEAGATPLAYENLGIDEYVKLFRSFSFRRQFLFMDGCQNHPYAVSARSRIRAMMHGGVAGYTPRPENSHVACFAAGQGQLAVEIDNRGAFMGCLLAALDPTRLASLQPDEALSKAVHLDLQTGGRTVDVLKVMDSWVGDVVRDAAARQTPPQEQFPEATPFGPRAPQPLTPWPIYRLPDQPTSRVDVLVRPDGATPDLRSIRVWCQGWPWERRVPVTTGPVQVPIENHLPTGLQAIAECNVEPSAPWDVVQRWIEFPTDQDRTVVFELSSRAPAPAPPPVEPQAEAFSINTVGPNGESVYGAFSYDDAARALEAAGAPDPAAAGIVLEHHENGPDLRVPADKLREGRELAAAWASAIRQVAPPEVAVSTAVRGWTEPPTPANLRLVLPPGGARRLAGVLADVRLLAVESAEEPAPLWRGGGQWSLAQVEAAPAVSVTPGPHRVRLDLPWGSWSQIVTVPLSGEASVELPTVVGRPPLRVALYGELGRQGPAILGVEGTAPGASVQLGLLQPFRSRLPPGDAGGAAWALAVNPSAFGGSGAGGAWLVTLDGAPGAPRAHFPLYYPGALAVDRSGGGLRVEPLSDVPSPEWDLLVSTGRLGVLPPDAAAALTEQKGTDEVLGLAGAYAVYAAGARDYLRVVVDNLARLPHAGLDVELLRITAEEPGQAPLSEMAQAALRPHAALGEVPLLRWGVRLALDLLGRADAEPPLGPWRTALAAVERGLSPISTWTAWTE